MGEVEKEAPPPRPSPPEWLHSKVAVGLCKTRSNDLSTGIVIKVQGVVCVVTARNVLQTARRALFAQITFVVQTDDGNNAVLAAELKPKTLFRVVGDLSVCACDWRILEVYGIKPLEIADQAYLDKNLAAGSTLYCVAHCLGLPERNFYPLGLKVKGYRQLVYEKEIPTGCHVGGLFHDGRLVGIHFQPSFEMPSNIGLTLHMALKTLDVHESDPVLEMKRLIAAIQAGDVDTLKHEWETKGSEYLKALRTDDGRDLLWFAAFYGDVDSCRCLLEIFGSSHVNHVYKGGVRLGHVCCGRGHLGFLKELYRSGPCDSLELGATDGFGNNVGHVAAANGHPHILNWLAKKAPSVLTIENKMGYNAAFVAASRGQSACLQALRDQGVVKVYGDASGNSKGMEPIDAVEDCDDQASRAYLEQFYKTDKIYRNPPFDRRMVPYFGSEFEAQWEGALRPFSREKGGGDDDDDDDAGGGEVTDEDYASVAAAF